MASEVVRTAEGARALDRIEFTLAARPEKDTGAISEAVEAICAFRTDLISRRDGGEQDRPAEGDLEALNGVLSIVLSIHFPLGPVRWHELEGARASLSDIVGRANAA